MLQQASPLAPSAPHDRGVSAGEALGAGQPGGDDFLALLEQAEGQEGNIPPGEVVTGRSAADYGSAGLATALVSTTPAPTHRGEALGALMQDGEDASDGTVLAGDILGGGAAGLAAGVPMDPTDAAPPPAMIVLASGVSALPVVTEGLVQPATGGAQLASRLLALPTQDDVPTPHLTEGWSGLGVMVRDAAPNPRGALTAKAPPDDVAGGERPAATSASAADPDSLASAQVASPGPAEESDQASALLTELGPPHPTGSTPALMAGPSTWEGRGLSMPADLSITGAGSLPGYLGSSPSAAPTATSLAFPYQRLLPPPLSAQVAPVVLSMGVVPGDDGGPGRLTVAIRPAELGTLQIITDRAEDGTARIAVFAERPETLQLLLRDAPTLETALRAAGVDEGGGLSLTFGLSSQGQGDRGGDARGGAGRAAGRHNAADPEPAIIASGPAMARTSLLDLSL
jgi:flagellar hook-length control protein FliK